LSQHP
jgi:hypothetical protein